MAIPALLRGCPNTVPAGPYRQVFVGRPSWKVSSTWRASSASLVSEGIVGPAANSSRSSSFIQRICTFQTQAMANAVEAHEVDEFVSVANELADVAANITVPYFRTRVDVEVKGDCSPVTIADKEAEQAMRSVLSHKLPAHSIYGEESGVTVSQTDDGGPHYCWVIDPIDGTKSFITGKPLFGTLIALLRDGVPIVGVIDQPILKERWVGAEGRPTTLNGSNITTRPCASLSSAYMYCTTPHMFSGESEAAFNRVRDQVRIPMYGCDCYAYGLLSAGHCDLVVEGDLKPYDYMALVPVIEGAGGCITDWKGQPLRLNINFKTGEADPYAGEVIAAGDSAVWKQALESLAWH